MYLTEPMNKTYSTIFVWGYQKTNSTKSVMLCMGDTFAKKNSCLVTRKNSFDTVGAHLPAFHILEPCPPKDISPDLSHVISHNSIIIVPFKPYLNKCL